MWKLLDPLSKHVCLCVCACVCVSEFVSDFITFNNLEKIFSKFMTLQLSTNSFLKNSKFFVSNRYSNSNLYSFFNFLFTRHKEVRFNEFRFQEHEIAYKLQKTYHTGSLLLYYIIRLNF